MFNPPTFCSANINLRKVRHSSGPTEKFPGHLSKSRPHLEWSSATTQEIYHISGFHKMVICRIQFQLSAAVGTKLKDIPVTQSHYVSTATCSHVIKQPQVPEMITWCITLQTSTHLIIYLFTLWFSIPLLTPLQWLARPHCKNETLTLLRSGKVRATKASFSSGAGVRSRGRNSLSNLQWQTWCIMKAHIDLPTERVKFSVIVLLATENCFEDVSFYTEAELLENWPGRNRLEHLQILFKHWSTWEILSQFSPDSGLKRTWPDGSSDD